MPMGTRKIKADHSFTLGILLGLFVSVVILLIGAIITASMIENEKLPLQSIKIASLFVLFVSAFVGNFISVKYINTKIVIASSISALVFALFLLTIGLLFFDGLNGSVWGNLISIVAASVVSCGVNTIKFGKNNYTKRRSR